MVSCITYRLYVHVVHYSERFPRWMVMYFARRFHASPSMSLVLPGHAFSETVPLTEDYVLFPASNKGWFMYQNDSIACCSCSEIFCGTAISSKLIYVQTPSIAHFFPVQQCEPTSQGASRVPGRRLELQMVGDSDSSAVTSPGPDNYPCEHLHGPEYNYYIATTHTRSLGGVSMQLRAQVARELFLYKLLPALKNGTFPPSTIKLEIPSDGNDTWEEPFWTLAEQSKLDATLRSHARWQVDSDAKTIRSTRCSLCTNNLSRVCDACESIKDDQALRHALSRVCQFFLTSCCRTSDKLS